MKNILLRHLNANLAVYILYFAIFALMGPITYYYLGEDFWIQTRFLSILSDILGFILFVFYFTCIYMLVFSINPYSKVVNFIQGINLVLLFILLDVILPERPYISVSLQFRGFILIAALILLLQLVAIVKVRFSNMRVVENEYKYYLQSHQLPEPISIDVLTFNISYFLVGFLAVSILNNQIGSWISFGLILIYNVYFIYRWMFILNASKLKKVGSYSLGLLLFAISVVVTLFFGEFMNEHSITRALLVTLPIIIYLPKVLRFHYIAEWSNHMKIERE